MEEDVVMFRERKNLIDKSTCSVRVTRNPLQKPVSHLISNVSATCLTTMEDISFELSRKFACDAQASKSNILSI